MRMSRDRFGSFTKIRSDQEACCLTQSFHFQMPCSLHANVEGASPAAPLRIAVVEDAERPLAGYTSELETSSLKTEVAWKAQKLLPAGRPFRIKVTWPAGRQDPKLYALYIELA